LYQFLSKAIIIPSICYIVELLHFFPSFCYFAFVYDYFIWLIFKQCLCGFPAMNICICICS
jgi:hypothetical protein